MKKNVKMKEIKYKILYCVIGLDVASNDYSIRQVSVPGKRAWFYARRNERSLLHECVQHSLHPAGCLRHLHQVGVGLHRPQLRTETLL